MAQPDFDAQQFTAARDSRNRRVPGPVVRNGRYFAVLWADGGDGKILLEKDKS